MPELRCRPNGRLQIGIWSEIAPGVNWANEGMTRLLGFLIEGAAHNHATTFNIVVHPQVKPLVESDFKSLDAKQGLDWVVHAPPEDWILKGIARSAVEKPARDDGAP